MGTATAPASMKAVRLAFVVMITAAWAVTFVIRAIAASHGKSDPFTGFGNLDLLMLGVAGFLLGPSAWGGITKIIRKNGNGNRDA